MKADGHMLNQKDGNREAFLRGLLSPSCLPDSGRMSAVRQQAKARWDSIAHPLGGLGKLEEMTAGLCGISGAPEAVDLSGKALVVFCGDHGVVSEGVSQSGQDVTRNSAQAIAEGRSTVGYMASCAGAEVYAVDVGISGSRFAQKELRTGAVIDRKIAGGTANLLTGPAMTEEECLKALETGVEICGELASRGISVLAAGEMGIGNTTSAGALAALLLDLSAEEVVGRGAGLDNAGLKRKKAVVAGAISRVRGAVPRPDVLRIMTEAGGFEIAAMTGLFLGGVRYGVPVVADGVVSLCAALMSVRLEPRAADILFVSHEPAEPGGQHLLRALGSEPILKGGFHLGEGSGAVCLFPLLDMAMAVYRDAPSFAERNLAAYRHFEEERAL